MVLFFCTRLSVLIINVCSLGYIANKLKAVDNVTT